MNRPGVPVALDRVPIRVRRRMDIESIEVRHRYGNAFHLKDPVALKYYRLRPDEYLIWSHLDSKKSLEELRDIYRGEFPSSTLRAADVNALLLKLHQSGLTVSNDGGQANPLLKRKRKGQKQRLGELASSFLFMKFPGIDPRWILDCLLPWFRPLLSPLGVILWGMFLVGSLGLFVSQYHSVFVPEFPTLDQWLTLDSVVLLMGVLAATKCLHELGHGLMCRFFGAHCRAIGPMLLVFTPALYCDTSDSWMLADRRQRALIGLAGILAELTVAALATWIWALTGEGILHSIAMKTMVVCGVSTVFFNLNPLLRYDGYYVLADLWDQPNLTSRSRSLIGFLARRWFLGDRSSVQPEFMHTSFVETAMLVTYGVAAAIYRWALTVVILFLVLTLFRELALDALAHIIISLTVVTMLFQMIRGPRRSFLNPASRYRIRPARAAFSLVLVSLVV
ncbi:MAG: peptidase M50, partial [Planctomycetota bacterium]